MRKKTVITGIVILFLIVILLGMVRYWMLEQRQTTHEQGTLVQICDSLIEERTL